MLYNKETAIAALVAVMLVASSFLGGLSLTPAYAEQVAKKTITQDDDESMTIGAIEFTARKSTSRDDGTVTIKVVQDNILASTTLSTTQLKTAFTTLDVELDDSIEVEGSFDIVVEYEGRGLVTVSDIRVSENTDTANEEEEEDGSDDSVDEDDTPTQPQIPLENVIARKTISQGSNDETTIDAIEFTARKSTSRDNGIVTIAIVQGNKVLDSEDINVKQLATTFRDQEIEFSALEVKDDFEIVIMHEGRGLITIAGAITVVGDTTASGDDDDDDPNDPENPPGTIELTVNAIDQNGNPVEGMWVAVLKGLSTVSGSGWTEEEFTLEEGEYTVIMDDYTDGETTWTFVEWKDSDKGKARIADLNDDETFTAVYNVVGPGATPPEDPQNPPAPPGDDEEEEPPIEDPTPGGPNTVTVQSKLLDGTATSGMLAQLRDSSGTNVQDGFTTAELTLEDGQEYRVIMYSFGEDFFRKWSNGHLHRYFPVEGDGTAYALTALYEHVPEGQQAKLEVRAITSDGQPIGGTTGRAEDGTLQARPGVEVQVAPPGSLTPFTAYTAGFSGGSEIEEQFYFFKGQTYVVAMQSFGELEFSHWEDNGSENSARSVPLSGDVTLTAVYNIVS